MKDNSMIKNGTTGWVVLLDRDDAEEVIDILCCVCQLQKHVTGLFDNREYQDLETRASRMYNVLDKSGGWREDR